MDLKKKKRLWAVTGMFGFLLLVSLSVSSSDPESEDQAAVVTAAPKQSELETSDSETDEIGTVEATDNEEVEKLYPVVSVVDGDTIRVSMDGQTEAIRLIGIDTPETVHPSKPVECFGREASRKARELLDGEQVRIETDSTQGERDSYGRLLAYVFLSDGTNFNKLMVEEGYAYEYTYDLPYKYQVEFKEAEKVAREGERGLWAEGACDGEREVEAKESSTPAPVVPVQNAGASSQSSQNCHPNYSGCLKPDAGDYDCAGGSGNGPNYTGKVRVYGSDPFRLDGDGDGWGCE